MVRTASRYKGVPYSFGGTTPRAFDCSGYVQYVFRQHKAQLPRTADLQFEKGLFVTQRQLKPGDLVFFSTYEPGASHVGIYAGNGLFWNATSSRGYGCAVCPTITGNPDITVQNGSWSRCTNHIAKANQGVNR